MGKSQLGINHLFGFNHRVNRKLAAKLKQGDWPGFANHLDKKSNQDK
jgi:hypothetical protein